MAIDNEIKKIITEVANEYNKSPEVVTKAWEYMWDKIKERIQQPDYPEILLHNFGRFHVKLLKVESEIKKHIYKYRNNRIDEETFKSRFLPLWAVRRRLQTYKEYRKKYKFSRHNPDNPKSPLYKNKNN
jgi:hypothetical protein